MSTTAQPDLRSLKRDAVRIRPYRRYLTSILHRRFLHASALALIPCLISAFWAGSPSSYRSFTSFCLIGVRVVLLYFCCLEIFILQVACLRLGRRTASSPFTAFRQTILSFRTAQVALWYFVSAWWFIEVYLWSRPQSEQLGWILKGGMSTPDRLNERPIYLRGFFFLLTLGQAISHLIYNHSSIELPIAPAPSPTSSDQQTHPVPSLREKARLLLPAVLARGSALCGLVAVLGPFFYAFVLRSILWSIHLSLAKPFFNIPRLDVEPTGYPPCNISMILHSFWAGLMLVTTWETTIFFFSALLAREPIEKNEPLSTASKDANGTLITGLVAKRDLVKTFALWELAIIARSHPKRRKFIFADSQREGGSAWCQMLNAAMAVIQDIETRIDTTKPTSDSTSTEFGKIESLPNLVPPAKTVDSIFKPAPPPKSRGEKIETMVAYGAKRVGQSSHPYDPDLAKTKSLVESGASRMPVVTTTLSNFWSSLIDSPFGRFFRSSFERQIDCVILGSPQSSAAQIVDAIESIKLFSLASLDEDNLGTVRRIIPDVVRRFTATVEAVESFVQSIKAKPDRFSDIEEVEIVLARLKAALAEILGGFQLYLSDEGLSAMEHRKAQTASTPRRLHDHIVEESTTSHLGFWIWSLASWLLSLGISASQQGVSASRKGRQPYVEDVAEDEGKKPRQAEQEKVSRPGRPQKVLGRQQSSSRGKQAVSNNPFRPSFEMEEVR